MDRQRLGLKVRQHRHEFARRQGGADLVGQRTCQPPVLQAGGDNGVVGAADQAGLDRHHGSPIGAEAPVKRRECAGRANDPVMDQVTRRFGHAVFGKIGG